MTNTTTKRFVAMNVAEVFEKYPAVIIKCGWLRGCDPLMRLVIDTKKGYVLFTEEGEVHQTAKRALLALNGMEEECEAALSAHKTQYTDGRRGGRIEGAVAMAKKLLPEKAPVVLLALAAQVSAEMDGDKQ